MQLSRSALIFGLFAAGLPTSAFSAKKAYQHFALPNGLEIFVLPQAEAQAVHLGVWYRAGLTSGSAAPLVARTVWDRIAPSGDVSTTADASRYEVTLPKNDLEFALAQEAQRMSGPGLSPVAFAEVSAAEPAMTGRERLMQILLGVSSQTSAVEFSEAEAFYRLHYTPSRAYLVVAGDVSPERVMSLVQKYFGALPQPHEPLPATSPAPFLPLASEIQESLAVAGLAQARSGLGFRLPGPKQDDHAAVTVASEMLESGGVITRIHGFSVWSFFAERPAGLTHAEWLAAFDRRVSELKLTRIEEALILAKERIRSKLATDLSSLEGLVRSAGDAVAICGHPVYFQQLLTRIATVRAADVLRVLRTYFNSHQRASVSESNAEKESSLEFH